MKDINNYHKYDHQVLVFTWSIIITHLNTLTIIIADEKYSKLNLHIKINFFL